MSTAVTLTNVSTVDASSGSDESTGMFGETSMGADDTTGAPGPCPVGSEGCSCTAAGACNPGLSCLSMICVDTGQSCPVGHEGCPCTLNGTCDPGLQCLSNVCVDPS